MGKSCMHDIESQRVESTEYKVRSIAAMVRRVCVNFYLKRTTVYNTNRQPLEH